MATEEVGMTTRNLKCQLTPQEVHDYGVRLARANSSKEEAEERKKEVDAQLKAEIESHSTKALNLARKINNGYEYREVECAILHDFKANTVSIRRVDTNELVETRALSAEERQTGLALS